MPAEPAITVKRNKDSGESLRRLSNAEMNAITDPGNCALVVDTTNNKIMTYNGSAWVEFGSGGGTPTIEPYDNTKEYGGGDTNNVDMCSLAGRIFAYYAKDATTGHIPTYGGGDGYWTEISSDISAMTIKDTPIDDDMILIEDSADDNKKKKITISSLPSGGGAFVSSGGVTLESSGIYTDSFLFGSPTIDNPDTNSETKIIFDKSKYGAFRAGYVQHAEWDSGNVGTASFACGWNTTASGQGSHSSGDRCVASGTNATAGGSTCIARGDHSHAEGLTSNTGTSATASHAEGISTANGQYSHSEGRSTTGTSAHFSHAEGDNTTTLGEKSHSEGYYTRATGEASHSEGANSWANTQYSHAEGLYSNTTMDSGHASASGRFTERGDAQFQRAVLFTETTSTTPTVIRAGGSSTPGDGKGIILALTQAIRFTAYVVASSDSTNQSASYTIEGFVSRPNTGGNIILHWSNIITDFESTALLGCDVTVSVNTSTQELQINAIGISGTTMRWVCTITMTELMGA